MQKKSNPFLLTATLLGTVALIVTIILIGLAVFRPSGLIRIPIELISQNIESEAAYWDPDGETYEVYENEYDDGFASVPAEEMQSKIPVVIGFWAGLVFALQAAGVALLVNAWRHDRRSAALAGAIVICVGSIFSLNLIGVIASIFGVAGTWKIKKKMSPK